MQSALNCVTVFLYRVRLIAPVNIFCPLFDLFDSEYVVQCSVESKVWYLLPVISALRSRR